MKLRLIFHIEKLNFYSKKASKAQRKNSQNGPKTQRQKRQTNPSEPFTTHHHHPTQCILFIEKLWAGSEEGRTAATHTHKAEWAKGVPQLENDKET